jgi:hypothetical protein
MIREFLVAGLKAFIQVMLLTRGSFLLAVIDVHPPHDPSGFHFG